MTEPGAKRNVAWRKFRRHTLSIYGGITLILLYMGALLADFIAPYDYAESSAEKSYFWPTLVHWRDEAGALTRPYVYNGYKLYDGEYVPHYVEGRPENMQLILDKLSEEVAFDIDSVEGRARQFWLGRRQAMETLLPDMARPESSERFDDLAGQFAVELVAVMKAFGLQRKADRLLPDVVLPDGPPEVSGALPGEQADRLVRVAETFVQARRAAEAGQLEQAASTVKAMREVLNGIGTVRYLRAGKPVEVDTEKYFLGLFVRRSKTHKLFWLFETNLHLFGMMGQESEKNLENPHRPMFFLLGSDQLGRCVFSRVMYGSRVSLSIGFVAVAISFTIGMLMGGLSGYFKSTTDVVIQRICEMMMMVPGFYLLLALRSAFPPEMSSTKIYFAVVTILAFIGWAGMARVIRGMVLGATRNEYVLAAQALGAGNLRVIVRHVLPTTFTYAIVSAMMAIPMFMLGESGLSFLGLGIQDPEASWGNMLDVVRDISVLRWHPWLGVPGLMIFITIVAYQFLGDGLRDAFDPRTIVAAKKKG